MQGLIADHRQESRIDAGRKLKSLYRCLGWQRSDLVSFLQVTERTVYRWEAGETAVPVSVTKLLRLLTFEELPGKTWEGWTFGRGRLWSPEGHGFLGTDMNWLSATVRRSQLFSVLMVEQRRLEARILELDAQLARARLDVQTAESRAGAFFGEAFRVALWEVERAGTQPLGPGELSAAELYRAERGKRDGLVTRPVCAAADIPS